MTEQRTQLSCRSLQTDRQTDQHSPFIRLVTSIIEIPFACVYFFFFLVSVLRPAAQDSICATQRYEFIHKKKVIPSSRMPGIVCIWHASSNYVICIFFFLSLNVQSEFQIFPQLPYSSIAILGDVREKMC